MNNKEYLNEEKYQKTKKILIIIGCISLAIGICLFIASFFVKVPNMGQEGWFKAKELKSILIFAAFPFGIMIPVVVFTTAFRREMTAFTAQQTMPVAKEGIDKMAPTVGNAAGEIAKGVVKGINEAKDDKIHCKHCGKLIDSDSTFCNKCGNKL